MPKGKHLRGVSSKEQRQYEYIKESAEKSGRYGKRAEEVAARTVMKQHGEEGLSKAFLRIKRAVNLAVLLPISAIELKVRF